MYDFNSCDVYDITVPTIVISIFIIIFNVVMLKVSTNYINPDYYELSRLRRKRYVETPGWIFIFSLACLSWIDIACSLEISWESILCQITIFISTILIIIWRIQTIYTKSHIWQTITIMLSILSIIPVIVFGYQLVFVLIGTGIYLGWLTYLLSTIFSTWAEEYDDFL